MVVTLDEILDKQEPVLAVAFATMVREIRDAYTLQQIETFLAAGRVEQALETALRFAPRIGDAYIDTYIAAGRDVARQIGLELGGIEVRFDIVNQRAVNAMQNSRLRLITEFSNEQRMATRQALTRGVREGLNPREQARAFRDSIGLTRRQEAAVSNYRKLLETGDRRALDRALRDKRYDRSVQSALDAGRRLPQSRIDRMVERYRERMVKYRSQVIARTEALRAVHEANHESFRQAIADGTLQENQLEQEWNTALDERVRGSHAAMHGQVQPVGMPFISGLGNQLMYPGDPSAPPEDVIQCRCSVGTRVSDAAAITGVDMEIDINIIEV